jgi:Flp pilus assembly protein TadG
MAEHDGFRRGPRRARGARRAGQSTVEFALSYAGVVFPLTFGIIYISQLLWVWHSVNDFTRQGAAYATTHCWESSADNVVQFMRDNVPPMINQNQFQTGQVQLNVTYQATDPDTGQLAPFQCTGDCTSSCIPQTVTVQVTGYQFTNFVAYLGLPPVTLPDFQTSLPMESAGCDPEQGVCLP